jgi:formiminotetrahydrofolate cyclodeaminase
MVANLTVGRKDYTAVEDEMKAISKQAADFRDKLIGYIDKDSDAYQRVMQAFKLPKNTEEEKNIRAQAVQEGLKQATRVPLQVAEDAYKIIELAGKVVEKGNRNAVTDGAVAAMMARTAVLSALYNVKTNLNQIKDRSFVDDVTGRVKFYETEIEKKEQKIRSKVVQRFIS